VQDDFNSTGGFLIIFHRPDDPSLGGDYWVERFEDVERRLQQLDCHVQLNVPLEFLRR
jgi:hypothetical protein